MKKSSVVIVLMLVAILIAAICTGARNLREAFSQEEITSVDTTTTELDLSGEKNVDVDSICSMTALKVLNLRETGLTAAEYEQIREILPDCEIFWQIPFQGEYLEPDTKELTISTLNQEDLASLIYLTQLETVHAEECEDLDMILELRKLHPEAKVDYIVPIDGRKIASDTAELMIVGPDPEEMERMLQYLPDLQKLVLTGTHPGNEVLYALTQAYPELPIVWEVDVLGKKCLNTVREVDISGIQVDDFSAVEETMGYFPNLEKLVMCRCGKSNEEMVAFQKSHPEVKIVWSVPVRFFWVRTDAKYLMPYQYGCTQLSNDDVESLSYLTELECIDFGHMEITDLSFLYSMPNVKYLIIADCGIWDITPVGSLKKLEYLEMFLNKVNDISALAGCPELRDINMCYNPVSDIDPLLQLEHLENLWAKGTYINWEQRQELLEAFPEARIVTYSNSISSTSEGWRQLPRYYEQRDFMGMWYTIEY